MSLINYTRKGKMDHQSHSLCGAQAFNHEHIRITALRHVQNLAAWENALIKEK
jgi:hypothetical protein